MAKLTLETFIAGSDDSETRQYVVLYSLKGFYHEFSLNRLYPTLSDLIDLCTVLEHILKTKADIEGQLPQQVKDVDLVNQRLVLEPMGERNADLERAGELITWALPLMKKAIEEGVEIYNFVEEHIALEEVGIVPMYREEGYYFVPEPKASLLHLLRYEVSLFTSAHERYRTLKTRLLESMEQTGVKRHPESIKLDLMGKYHDLPNPATYVCDTDLDFPYAETILPVAKRKLMEQLFS